jgi:hypothetical protein
MSATTSEPSGICVVTAGGPYPWIIINALGEAFGPIDVILEAPEPRGVFLKRRARKLGWFAVAGQFGTMVLVRLGKKRFAERIKLIVEQNGLREEPDPGHRIVEIATVNSQAFVDAVGHLDPKVILLAGCRIVRPEILRTIKCPVLNYHAGINPQYRGLDPLPGARQASPGRQHHDLRPPAGCDVAADLRDRGARCAGGQAEAGRYECAVAAVVSPDGMAIRADRIAQGRVVRRAS